MSAGVLQHPDWCLGERGICGAIQEVRQEVLQLAFQGGRVNEGVGGLIFDHVSHCHVLAPLPELVWHGLCRRDVQFGEEAMAQCTLLGLSRRRFFSHAGERPPQIDAASDGSKQSVFANAHDAIESFHADISVCNGPLNLAFSRR